MGYFPGYEMEECQGCGRSSCNGNCRENWARPERREVQRRRHHCEVPSGYRIKSFNEDGSITLEENGRAQTGATHPSIPEELAAAVRRECANDPKIVVVEPALTCMPPKMGPGLDPNSSAGKTS